jgi:RNA polymerase sigma-70 factor (ECF subfamily)
MASNDMSRMEDTLIAASVGRTGWTAEEFDCLVRDHQARIQRVLWYELRDDEAAATLTQECFLKAYRARHEFRGESSVQTWLVRIALNLARDHQRNRRQGFWRRLMGGNAEEAERATAMAEDGAPLADRRLLARERLERVMRAVETLSPQQQTVFRLRFVEEMTLEEIALAMDVEVGTVKSHLSRAVSALRFAEQSAAGRKEAGK